MRQAAAQARDQHDGKERQRKAKAERGEHCDRAIGREQQRSAQRGAEERAGARRRDERGERAGAEAAGRAGVAAKHGQFEQPQQVQGDRGREQQQDDDGARVLQLERPAGRTATGANREQQRAEQPGADHRAAGVSERITPRATLVAARLGEMQRLQGEDREDARHQVEQHAADQRAEDGDQHCAGARPVGARDGARQRV